MFTPVMAKPEHREPSLVKGENENVQKLPRFEEHGMVHFATDFQESLDYLAARRTKIVHQLNPAGNPRAVVELGDIHLAKKELKLAEKAYRDAIRKDPSLIDAYKKLIPLLVARSDLRLASIYYERFVKATNSHPEALHEYLLFRLTFFSQESGEIKSIQSRLRELIKENPEQPELRVTLGITVLVYESDAQKARPIFQDVLDEYPENIDALNNIGICFQRKEQFDKAYKCYRKALTINPKYSPAYENIASNYVSQKKFDEALAALLEGRDANLQYTPLWDHNTGWLMMLTGKMSDAKSWYIKKIKEEPNNNLLFNNLGACYEHLGDLDAALENYQKAVKLTLGIKERLPAYDDPRALNGFHNLCRLLQKENNFPLLEAVAKHLLTFQPNSPAGFYYLGGARIQLKKHQAARAALEKSIAIEDGVAAPYIDLSFLLECILHEYSDAVQLLETAMEKGLHDEYIINNLAFAYVKNRQVDDAERLLDFKETYPNTTATRGLVEFYKGNFEAGNKLYRQALNGIKEGKKDEAKQIWHYEQAAFWFRQDDLDKTMKYLDQAKSFGEGSYIYSDILRLEGEVRLEKKRRSRPKSS